MQFDKVVCPKGLTRGEETEESENGLSPADLELPAYLRVWMHAMMRCRAVGLERVYFIQSRDDITLIHTLKAGSMTHQRATVTTTLKLFCRPRRMHAHPGEKPEKKRGGWQIARYSKGDDECMYVRIYVLLNVRSSGTSWRSLACNFSDCIAYTVSRV